ncbi:cohesin domain-containing protein [Methanolobus sp. WCC4]|uniref:cohesin domain-containing protein n=1 Tax=Methanolobus sp. WCC4 TaxID=3125784 RepID=UPI0030F88D0E
MTNEKIKGKVASSISLLIFCACFMVGIGFAAAAPSLSINPELTDGLAPTDTFSVTVDVDSDGASLEAMAFKMAYDTSAFSVTSATYDGLMGPEGSDVIVVKDFTDDGEISFSAGDGTPAAQAGSAVTVNFAVKAGASDGMYDLDLKDARLISGGADIPGVVVNDGQAEIGDDVVIPSDDPFVQVIADAGVFSIGDTFQATIVMDSEDSTISAVDLSLIYDSSALSVTGASYSGLMGAEGSDVIVVKDFTDDGMISFAAGDATPTMQAGTLLTIDFMVKAGASDGTYSLDLDDATLVNGGAVIPDVDVIDDSVEISSIPVPEGIDLLPGWNLISIPETLENGNIDYVLQDFNSSVVDSVFYDDASTGMMVVPTDFEPLKAYWVHNNLDETVVINEDYLIPMVPSTPPSLMLYPGWNAIGHTAMVELPAEVALSTIDDCYSKVQGPWVASTNEFAYVGYNGEEGVINGNQIGTDIFDMNMYEGYYVFVDQECLLG